MSGTSAREPLSAEAGIRAPAVSVVGGMNLDILGIPAGEMRLRDSNIGTIRFRPGGVGRNIAQRLAENGAKARLCTAISRDERSHLLKAACADSGIDLSLSVETDLPTPCYLCVHDAEGDMLAALNDMAAMEELTPAAISSRLPLLNAADACVLDANLPQETLLYLARHVTVPLILEPVSCVKAKKALPILPYLAAIKPNRMESEELTGEKDMDRAANRLLAQGVGRVFISLGKDGVLYRDAREGGVIPAIPLPRVPLTGAGDALCAGLTLALTMGKSVRECAENGVRIAYQAMIREMPEESVKKSDFP